MKGQIRGTKMKKLTIITTTAVLATSITGCKFNQENNSSHNRTDVSANQSHSTDFTAETTRLTESAVTEKADTSSVKGKTYKNQKEEKDISDEITTPPESNEYVSTETSENTSSEALDQKIVPVITVNVTSELTPYQKELNRLTEEINKAAEKLTAAKAAYKKAQEEYDAAKLTLNSMTSLTFDDKDALEVAKALVGAKKAALEVAASVLEQVEENYADALDRAGNEYTLKEAAARAAMDTAKENAKTVYEGALEESRRVYDEAIATAQSNYNTALKTADEVKKQKDADSEMKYKEAVLQAGIKFNADTAEAKAKQEKANSEAEAVYYATIAEAEKEYLQALTDAKNKQSYIEAANNLTAAINAQKEAMAAKTEAEGNLADAKDELALARQEQEAQDIIVKEKKSEKELAEQALNDARTLLKKYETQLKAAKNNKEDARNKVEEAKAAVVAAETRVANADIALDTANEANALAQTRIEEAQEKVNSAQTALEEANAAINKGMLGFFEYRKEQGDPDAQTAITILSYASSDNRDESVRTEIGAEGDATALENVKAAFDYLEEGNQKLAKDGYETWNINHRLMALAEMNANTASFTIAHPSESGQVPHDIYGTYEAGENLYWKGNKNAAFTLYSPYAGWYDEEKAIFESGTDYSATGHYRNLIDYSNWYPGTQVSGFAINNETAKVWTTFAQEFSSLYRNENAYTVEEYKEMFLEYYNSVMEAANEAQSKLDSYQAALEDLQNRDGLTEEETQAIADAEAEVKAAKAVLRQAGETLTAANLNMDAMAEALISAQNAYDKQTITVEEKAVEYSIAYSEFQTAEALASEKEKAVTVKESDAEAAEQNDAKALAALIEANKKKAIAEDAVAEENQRVEDETADEKQAVEDAKASTIRTDTAAQAQKEFDESTAAASSERETTISDAENRRSAELEANANEYDEVKAGEDQKLAEAETNAETARTAADSEALKEKREDENNAVADYNESVTKAQNEYEFAVDQAETEREAAQSEYTDAEISYNESVDVSNRIEAASEDLEAAKSEVQIAEDELDAAEANKESYETGETDAPTDNAVASTSFEYDNGIRQRVRKYPNIFERIVNWFKKIF